MIGLAIDVHALAMRDRNGVTPVAHDSVDLAVRRSARSSGRQYSAPSFTT
jgi:hypothetical protein